MAENLAIFLRFYREPGKAASDALDKGSFAFALTLAVFVMMLSMFTLGIPLRLAFIGMAAIFLVMVPVSIAVVAAWDSLGSIGVVLRREYISLLVPALLAWAAVHFPFALAQMVAPILVLPVLAHIAFLALYTICLRTALGSTTGHAAVAVTAGWVAAIAAFIISPLIGNLSFSCFPLGCCTFFIVRSRRMYALWASR
jgi:hypothetical protein